MSLVVSLIVNVGRSWGEGFRRSVGRAAYCFAAISGSGFLISTWEGSFREGSFALCLSPLTPSLSLAKPSQVAFDQRRVGRPTRGPSPVRIEETPRQGDR